MKRNIILALVVVLLLLSWHPSTLLCGADTNTTQPKYVEGEVIVGFVWEVSCNSTEAIDLIEKSGGKGKR